MRQSTFLMALFGSPFLSSFSESFTTSSPKVFLPRHKNNNGIHLLKLTGTSAATSSTLLASTSSSETAFQQHAREVFSLVDADGSDLIDASELGRMLRMLDIDATDEDAEALFKFLDSDGSGQISFEEFEPWYMSATEQAQSDANVVQNALLTRKTVNDFDKTSVSKDVLDRAVECAIASPSIGGRLSEHWRFIDVGPTTVQAIAELKASMLSEGGLTQETGEYSPLSLREIPGWCVVTTELNPDDEVQEMEDYAATCCAIQNFMLSMWGEGIGTKWAAGPLVRTQNFADLVGVDTSSERVVGCILYGFARGGLGSVEKTPRTKGVEDVLTSVP